MKKKTMNTAKTLSLILQKRFAEEIIHGSKVREYRDYTQFYLSKLINFKDVSDKTVQLDNGTHFTPIHYDFIRFYWYTKEYLLVECKGWTTMTPKQAKNSSLEGFEREGAVRPLKPGEHTLYSKIKDEYDLDGAGDDELFIVFSLGKVIENNTNIK